MTDTIYPTTLNLSFASFNIRNLPDLPRSDVVACAKMVADHSDAAGLQEISGKFDDVDVDSAMPIATWLTWGQVSENTIKARNAKFVPVDPSSLTVPQNDRVKLSDGVAHVSPRRDAVYSVLRFLDNPNFTATALMDFHLVSGIKPGATDQLAVRKKLQAEEQKNLTLLTKKLIDAGLNVLWVADTNYFTVMPALHPNQRWLINNGIDKIAWIPCNSSNFDLTLVNSAAYKGASDHKLQVADVSLVSNDKYPYTFKERLDRWAAKYQVTNNAMNELNDILSIAPPAVIESGQWSNDAPWVSQ